MLNDFTERFKDRVVLAVLFTGVVTLCTLQAISIGINQLFKKDKSIW